MKDTLLTYFEGEKSAGLVLAFIGLANLALAAALGLRGGADTRPLAVALLVLALLEIAVGGGLYAKTGPQVAALLEGLEREPATFYAKEGARMAKVQKTFVTLEIVWCALLAAGAATAVALKSRPVPSGVACALVVTAGLFLAFDLVAERRGAVYYAALREPETPAPVVKRNPYDP